MDRIYFDNNATTPTDPQVTESMLPYFSTHFGNSSSSEHSFGWDSELAIEESRKKVAHFLNTESESIFFTSGATESHNLLFLSIFTPLLLKKQSIPHIITSAIEHKSILKPLEQLKSWGCELTILPVDKEGLIRLKDLESAIKPNTELISIQWANNEIGCVQPITEISMIAKKNNILFHTDAVQTAGKLPIDLSKISIDFLSLSGHKFYGPKGVGALYIKDESQFKSLYLGGNQESKIRPGTTNVPAIVGLGVACELSQKKFNLEISKLKEFSEYFYKNMKNLISEIQLNGPSLEDRLPGQLNLTFPFKLKPKFSRFQKFIACSKGSTCTGDTPTSMSHVLQAIGVDPLHAQSTLRFCFGRFNSKEELDFALKKAKEILST